MIIQKVRVDWLFATAPSKKGKYGCCAMLPLGSPDLKRVEEALAKAKQVGITKGLFTEANTKSAKFSKCLRSGNEEIESEDRPVHYKDHMFFNASSKTRPGIRGADNQPLLDPDLLFSGCYVHLDVNFYPFAHKDGGKGVTAGFNNIMLYKEGPRLDGRVSADEAFADIEVEDGDLE